MAIQRSLASWTAIVLLAITTDAVAQNGKSGTNQGSTPNGKPFEQIQSQFAQLDARLLAVENLVAGVESSLQAQIALLNDNLEALQTQANTVEGAVTALDGTVAANTAAIGALTTAVYGLQSALSDAQAAIAANSGDIQALQGQVNGITSLINGHTSQIASLQQQTTLINQFLANLVNGNCQAGQVVNDIRSGGFISCTAAGAGGTLAAHTNYTLGFLSNFGPNTLIVSCQPGYTLTGSGHFAPSYYEGFSYATPAASQRTSYKSPVSVTSSFPWFGTVSVTASYTPESFYGGWMYGAIAQCARMQ